MSDSLEPIQVEPLPEHTDDHAYSWHGVNAEDTWMQVASGARFHMYDPKPGEFDINDIARALSKACRYGGHLKRRELFYSVAQHSVLVCDVVTQRYPDDYRLQMQALLHDAAEAYIGDLPHPIKVHMPQFQELDNFLTAKVFTAFGVDWNGPEPMPPAIKDVDRHIVRDEGDVLLPDASDGFKWWHEYDTLGLTIRPWVMQGAEKAFLDRYTSLRAKLRLSEAKRYDVV